MEGALNVQGMIDQVKLIGKKKLLLLDFAESHGHATSGNPQDANNGYNDEMIKPFFTEGELSDYADLLLGRQIRDNVKEFGECHFDAEL